jgi:predicted transposase YdaD
MLVRNTYFFKKLRSFIVRIQGALQKGREEGWEKRGEETVKNLLEFAMGPEQLAQALKLPLDTARRYFCSE